MNSDLNIDPQFEDLVKLKPVSRRGFFAQILAGLAAGTALASKPVAAAPASNPNGVAAPDEEAYWRWIADQFLIRDDVAYMNTGTRGPSPRSVYQAEIDAIRQSDTDRLSFARYVHNAEFLTATREKMAAYLGCNVSEVAFTNNTTEGMAIGTFGPDLKPGDEIIYTNHDHSSGAQPVNLRAARFGIKPVVVDLSDPRYHPPKSPDDLLKAIEAAITRKTRLISFCHINYTDGCVLPVKEICDMARSRGVMTLVDGAHPPGMLVLNLHDLGCDMYAGACHKWMLASMLTGFFYVRDDIQEQIWPLAYSGPVNGQNMYRVPVSEQSAARANSAQKYEMHGSTSYAAKMSVDAALDFHNRITPRAVENRDRYLAQLARDGLRNIPGVDVFVAEDPSLCAGIVSFKVKHIETSALSKTLWDRHKIYIRNVTHEEINWDANRVSLHLMTTAAQVDLLVQAVEEAARQNA